MDKLAKYRNMTLLLSIRITNRLDGVKKVSGTLARPCYNFLKILDGDDEHGIFGMGSASGLTSFAQTSSQFTNQIFLLWSFKGYLHPLPPQWYFCDCNVGLLLKLLFTTSSKSELVGYLDLMDQAFGSTDAGVSFLNNMTQLEWDLLQ